MLARAKNFFKFFLGFPLTVISLYFIFSFIYSNRQDVLPLLGSINPFSFITGIILLVIFFLLRSLAWHEVLKREGYENKRSTSTYLLASSEIKRYIPGSVLGFISRVNNFSSPKIPSKVILKLIFYESVIFLLSSVLTSIPGVIFVVESSDEIHQIYYYAAIFFTLIISVSVGFIIYKFTQKNSLDFKLLIKRLPEFKNSSLLMFFAWIFFGLGNYLLGASFYFLNPDLIIQLSSFFILSWLIGYVVLVVPLGLGVREAAVVYGLSTIMQPGVAAALSVILRIGLILSELIFLILSFFAYKFSFLIPKIKLNLLILWGAILSYITYFSYYSIERHNHFFTGRYDLGNMTQTVWNTLHGRFFVLTNPDGTESMLRLGIHADFLLVLLTPFYILWEDPRMLLVIQTVVIGLGAYFVYQIASVLIPKHKHIQIIFAVSYLLNPWIQRQNLFDFHPVSLATTFLLGCVYFMLVKKYKFFLLFLLLAVLTKEQLYLVAMLLGIYLFFNTGKKMWLFLSVISGALFYILVSKVIPWARGGAHFAIDYFSEFGQTPFEITRNIVFNPVNVVSIFTRPENTEYLLNMFVPLGFLSFVSPIYLIFATPDLLISLLSDNQNLRDYYYHYGAVVVPFAFVSAIYAVKKLLSLKLPFINPDTVFLYLTFFSILGTYLIGVLPGSKYALIEIYTQPRKERFEIKKFLEGIHPDLSVAATNNLGAHLSHRESIYTLPIGLEEADVVVLLFDKTSNSKDVLEFQSIDFNLSRDERYIEIYKVGNFSAYSKIDAAAKIIATH